jgi:hypothetical protein
VLISEGLELLGRGLTREERKGMQLLLSSAAAGISPNGERPQGPAEADALAAIIYSLAALQPRRNKVPPSGVAFRGRPSFLTDALFRELSHEAALRRREAVLFERHLVAKGGPAARKIADSTALLDLVRSQAGYVCPTERTNYIFYDEEGLGISPHVDNEEFPLNAILMLHHTFRGAPSHLLVYRPDSAIERIRLAPGEMLILFADSVVHAREPMHAGESLSILAFGFNECMEE